MKATGVVRRIDDLGRVVIPKEIRKTLRIKEGDPLEIFTDREKLFQRRQRFPGRNVIDIPPAVPQIIAHLILGNTFFQPKLRNPLPYKILIHFVHLKDNDNLSIFRISIKIFVVCY